MAHDGSVRIDTRLNLAKLEKDISAVRNRLTKLQKDLNSGVKVDSKEFDDVKKSIDSISSRTKELTETTKNIRPLRLFGDEDETRLQAYINRFNELHGLKKEFETPATYFGDITDEQADQVRLMLEQKAAADEISSSVENVAKAQSQVTQNAYATRDIMAEINQLSSQLEDAEIEVSAEGIDQAAASATRLKSALSGIAVAAGVIGTATVKAFGMMRTAISRVISSVRTLARLIMGSFRTMGSAIASAARITAGLTRGIINATRNVFRLGRGSNRAAGGVNNLGRRFIQLAGAAFVFNVLRRGLRQLSQQLGRTLMANQEFAASWNAIKVNMSAAIAPLLDVVIPALVRLMQILAQITALLAQFMATLFGVSVSQARQSARAYNAAAGGIGGVGGAAKDAAKHLAKFDEINQAAAESGGSSGGGSGGGMDFDIPIAETAAWIDKLAEMFRNFFRVADFEGWFTLGAIAADKFTAALNRIPWRRLRQGARAAGENMAGLLSGFFSNIEMWETVGNAIAEGLNTALDFLESYASSFFWRDVGRAIGSGINTFIRTFDWQLAARTFNAWAIGILDLLQTAIQTVHWWSLGRRLAEMLNAIQWRQIFNTLGETLAEALNAMTRTLSAFARRFDWRELGSAITSGINTFFTNWNAREAADAVNSIALGLLDMIRAAIDKIDMPLIESSLKDFIGRIQWKEIISGTISVIGDIKLGFLNLLLAAVQTIPWREIGEGIRDGISTIPWSEVLGTAIDLIGSVTTGLLEMLLAATAGITPERMREIGANIAQKLQALPWGEILGDAGALVGRVILGFLSFLQGIIRGTDWRQVGRDIASFLEGLGWGDILRTTGRLIIEAIAAAMKIFAELPRSWNVAIGALVTALGAALLLKVKVWYGKVKLFLAGPKILKAAAAAGGTVGKSFTATATSSAAVAGGKVASAFGLALSSALVAVFAVMTAGTVIENIRELGFRFAASFSDETKEELGRLPPWMRAEASRAIIAYGEGFAGSSGEVSAMITETGASLGENIVRSVADGTSRFPLIDFFRNLFSRDVIKNVEKVLEINSPSKVFVRIAEYCVAGFTRGFVGITDKAASIFGNVWSGIQDVFSNTQTWFGDTFTKAKDAVSDAWSAVGEWFSDRWRDIQGAFRNTGEWFRNTFNTARTNVNNVWQTVGSWFGDRWTSIQSAFANTGEWFKTTFNTARTNINNVWENVGGWFSGRWENIKSAFSETASWFRTRFDEARTSMEGAFDPNTIRKFFSGVWGTIQGAFSNAVEWFRGLGGNIMDGLRGGIEKGQAAAIKAMENVNKGLQKVATKINKISSPSRWWRDNIGLMLGYGIADGLENSASYIFKTLKDTFTGLQNSAESYSFVSLGRDMALDLLNGMKQAYDPIIDFFKSLMDNIDTILSTPIQMPRIPQLRGCLIDSATISMMVEKGKNAAPLHANNEIVRMLERLEKRLIDIERATGNVTVEGGSFNVNGRELARITYEDFEAEARRRGFRINGKELGFAR